MQAASISYRGSFFNPIELKTLLLSSGDLVADPRNNSITPRVNLHRSLQSFIHSGDINVDASVDIKDSVLSLQIVSGVSPAEDISIFGDCNDDNKIGIAESIFQSQVAAGLLCPDTLLDSCNNKDSCEASGGVWAVESCNPPPVCGPDDLAYCTSELECRNVGGEWFKDIACIYNILAWESENNDELAQADALEFNQPLGGNLRLIDDVDYFVFNIDKPETITLSIEGDTYPIGYTRWNISVIDEVGQPIIDRVIDWGADFGLSLPTEGTYYIKVMRGPSSSNYDYTLFVAKQLDPAPSLEIEPNDDTVSATPIYSGKQVTGQLAYYTDNDWYVFSSSIPQVVTVSLDDDGNINTRPTNWHISVYDSNNEMLTSSYSGNLSFDVLFPRAGEYNIAVTASAWDSNPYHLQIQPNTSQPPPSVESEFNDTAETADLIPMSTWTSGILMSSTDQDWFVFHSDYAESPLFTFSTWVNPAYTDWDISLYDANENVLMTTTTSSGSFYLPLLDVGNYYIKVNSETSYYKFLYKFKIDP